MPNPTSHPVLNFGRVVLFQLLCRENAVGLGTYKDTRNIRKVRGTYGHDDASHPHQGLQICHTHPMCSKRKGKRKKSQETKLRALLPLQARV